MHAEPIYCFRPTPERAATFAAPPYDVFDRASAKAYAAAHPGSFLEIDRPETGFPSEQDMYAPEVYAHARDLLNSRVADGTLLRDERPCYYVWRQKTADHTQTGVVCGCAVADYDDGTVKRHENVLTSKMRDRMDHIRVTNAQTGPAFLAYRDNPTIDALVALAQTAQPLYDFTDANGVRNTVWRVSREAATGSLELMFQQVPCAYIADGHHRTAAAVAVCHEGERGASGARPTDEGAAQPTDEGAAQATDATQPTDATRALRPNEREEASTDPQPGLFLAVLFPASQLQILPYDRVIRAASLPAAEDVLAGLGAQGFACTPADGPVDPAERRHFGLRLYGNWYELTLAEGGAAALDAAGDDPVASLDTSLVQNHILAPIFGVDDPRTDDRLSFIGGFDAAERSGEAAGADGIALALHATSMDELMAVSDAGLLMPPKSTWFEPKLLSGLFIRHI